MGEARRRLQEGRPPGKRKTKKQNQIKDGSPRLFPWLPITQNQKDKFYQVTIRGGWIGLALLVVIWVTVRIIGPTAGWWTPADFP